MKLLLVEPDKVLAQTYASYLRQQGWDVKVASGAQSAVHVLDIFKPELIILELQLARHNGIEFLYELRSYVDWQEIPVIAHTLLSPGSLGFSTDVLNALGVVQYLYKPATNLQRLARVVREELQPAAA
jgi:DNA-binding response OmpR family regulator